MRILNDEQETLLKEERQYLEDLMVELEHFGVTDEDRQTLMRSIRQIDDLFLLVVVGEFNSGKSTFINTLLGEAHLEEGVTPTTTQVAILRYGEQVTQSVLEHDVMLMTIPAEILIDLSIVDTPGTNAVIREHETITARFVPRADLVLFITSADRPFTESERAFLEVIRDWGKKLIVVINKSDIFQKEGERQEVEEYVLGKLKDLLGLSPPVFSLSSRQGLQAKKGKPELWSTSGFGLLEDHIRMALDPRGRLKLKFLNPLGVGLKLVDSYLSTIEGRLSLLEEDLETLDVVKSQINTYQSDMKADFDFRMADLEKVLLEMEQRGNAFFEDMMRLSKVLDLIDKNFFQKQFQKRVVADVPEQVEQKVEELIDWMVDRDYRLWEGVTGYLSERRREHEGKILEDARSAGFQFDRKRLIEAVGDEANRVVELYDQAGEARKLAEGAQASVAAVAVLEVGAVGLGTLVAVLTSTVAVDVTGVLLASALAVLGLFVLPARRKQARREMTEKVVALRERLVGTLRERFEQELTNNLERIREAVRPYDRFVRSEQSRLVESRSGLGEVRTRLSNLQERVSNLEGDLD